MKRLIPCLFAALFASTLAQANDKPYPPVRIAWTLYVGSMPLGYAQDTGILKKWGERYGVDLQAVQVNDYIEAINQYSLGEFDGVIAMLLDALTIPAAAGVDTSVPLLLSTSMGNDGIIVKGSQDIASLKGQNVNLVQFSGSHYLLARALERAGLSERDLQVVNTSDADMIAVFPDRSVKAMATWQPQLAAILDGNPDSHLAFSSADIPGEISDGLLLHTTLLKDNPGVAKALAGAWHEVMEILATPGERRDEAVAQMAEAAGTDAPGFEKQLQTTHFYGPAEGAAFVASQEFRQGLARITEFSFKHGLLGEGADSPDAIGIDYQGSIVGNTQRTGLRFPSQYMQEAGQ
ncbi:putative urea ABC transporter substrate-binding protein [Stutzerimonas kirkiae]|uniref:putative urea ABC transporter substrate-binding protein n=1 Tax=Stutzerimonas kirkiae TaxID=2211392 RepID=UPI001038402E|nr:putative urea ABC transporter substrate-binding protein [Stutzerimonas kirkiae]TBV08792.1 nitrate ABC transporter substrate-binding protein [Stutzerimonas kirkiae]